MIYYLCLTDFSPTLSPLTQWVRVFDCSCANQPMLAAPGCCEP